MARKKKTEVRDPRLSLYERLCNLRLRAAVLYDMGTAAGIESKSLQADIEKTREFVKEHIQASCLYDLGEVVHAIKSFEDEADLDMRRIERHKEKAKESLEHAKNIKEILKEFLLSQEEPAHIIGNCMATVVNGELHIR